MKNILISLLALNCLMAIKPISMSSSFSKTYRAKEEDNGENYGEEPYNDEIYQENDYQYDKFLEEIIDDATMDESETDIEFEGVTTPDYGEFHFRLGFNMSSLQYDYDFSESMTEVYCEKAFVDRLGGLESQIVINNPDMGTEETYYLSNYRNTQKLEDFVIGTDENKEIAAYGITRFSWFENIIRAIVTIFVIVAETAEQVNARINYQENQRLEQEGNGMTKGNYIFNQEEVGWDGFNCGNYGFGFTTFKGVGCEVASVYNLMISEGLAQDLSKVIYDFEKWAIEFNVGWGYLGSNPRDIYRYLRNYGIGYSKDSLYPIFNFRINLAPVGTRMIYSAFNPESLSLHTFFILKRDGYFETYNFKSNDVEYYDTLDDIDSQMGAFIVRYKIHD